MVSNYPAFHSWWAIIAHSLLVWREIGISPAFLSWWAIIAHLLVNNSRPLEWTTLSHVSPMASHIWLPLRLAAHPNLAYSYHTIRRAMWSAQKPCRTEESIMLLDFYILVIWYNIILIVLCIPRAKPGISATFYYWIIQINHLLKIWLFTDILLS